MLFNSIEFLLFLPTVVVLYFRIPQKYRWGLLLFSSCVFYMAFIPSYILILAVTIVIDYVAALYIEKSEGRKRRYFLIVSIISTCLVLFIFKYFDFFNSNFVAIARALDLRYPVEKLNLLLPIGLSFHTFQSLSYVIEVYYKRQKAERHFGIYALYVMFFPQLVAGPIERPQNLLHQFYDKHEFNYDRVVDGIKLMAWGFFKKIAVADRVACVVNTVYGDPGNYSGLALVLATVFFAIQIYCDFSGYSDIARGCARILGFELRVNFNTPYFSASFSEFWKRWHISLSTWFRDYVYIPLGGSRVPWLRWQANLLIVFCLSGFWHGANWTFIIWGLLNGFYVVMENSTMALRRNVSEKFQLGRWRFVKISKQVFTFALICIAWIFFRARNLTDAHVILQNMMQGWSGQSCMAYLQRFLNGNETGLEPGQFEVAIILIVALFTVEIVHARYNIKKFIGDLPGPARFAVYYGCILGLALLGMYGSKQPFIYFQF